MSRSPFVTAFTNSVNTALRSYIVRVSSVLSVAHLLSLIVSGALIQSVPKF